ncbi:hypothetical protein [Hymenobacter elongatus]|uniref:STAS/SEC14 domain-containing protein n=1 Tax=Hymenobacter elongatus TaxID=877208 RepID=A0A4Z0PPH9_9BACT|nr:hypothetical protein [Hymenobacter elongatus]TGE16609.1 hypothetical protein E5J99_09540 [Hymenobacter elongatus]
MRAPDPTVLTLQFRADLGILTARWLGAAPLADLQAGHHAMLDAALEHQMHRWLMDRRRSTPDVAIATWVSQEWLPAAAAQLTSQLRLASLVSPELWQAISSQAGLREAAALVLRPNQPFLVKVFTDEGEAVRWLMETGL